MRLAYLIDVFPKLSETFIAREIVALRRVGRAPTLFVLRRGDEATADAEVREIAREAACVGGMARGCAAKLHWFARRPLRMLTTGLSYVRGGLADPRRWFGEIRGIAGLYTLARLIEREKIEHLHAHFASLPATYAWHAHRLTGVPYSLSVHAWDVYVQRVHLRAKLRDAARVVFCHQAALDHVRERWPELDAGRFRLIHHGVDLSRYAQSPPRVRSADEPLRVLAVGRLDPKKGFDVLLRAAAGLARRSLDFTLEIVGEGPMRRSLETAIREEGLEERVRIAGALPHGDVIDRMTAAHVLAAPSRIRPDGDRDGIPNVIVEAMSAGLPVVCSQLPGPAEAVRDGQEGLLVPPDDPAALADALARIAREPRAAQGWGAAGRARAEALFDQQKNIRGLVELFDDLDRERT